jgi:hypothetical protein
LVCRQVKRQTYHRRFRSKGKRDGVTVLRGTDDLSCEIARTYARAISLTTGTFNLVVKDRNRVSA